MREEFLRCKSVLQKDNYVAISNIEKAIKSEIASAISKYADFDEKDIYFEIAENRGKTYVRFEANLKI